MGPLLSLRNTISRTTSKTYCTRWISWTLSFDSWCFMVMRCWGLSFLSKIGLRNECIDYHAWPYHQEQDDLIPFHCPGKICGPSFLTRDQFSNWSRYCIVANVFSDSVADRDHYLYLSYYSLDTLALNGHIGKFYGCWFSKVLTLL
jgi:hypothetical protein